MFIAIENGGQRKAGGARSGSLTTLAGLSLFDILNSYFGSKRILLSILIFDTFTFLFGPPRLLYLFGLFLALLGLTCLFLSFFFGSFRLVSLLVDHKIFVSVHKFGGVKTIVREIIASLFPTAFAFQIGVEITVIRAGILERRNIILLVSCIHLIITFPKGAGIFVELIARQLLFLSYQYFDLVEVHLNVMLHVVIREIGLVFH